jgi:hypothetical protein
VRKLWIARALVVITAAGLGAVVIEERREQSAADRDLKSVSGPSGARQAVDPDRGGDPRPRGFSPTPRSRPLAERSRR